MKNKLNWLFLLTWSALWFWGCQPHKQPVRLATYTYSTNNRIENMRLLSEELAQQLQREVEMTSYPDVESFIAAIKANEVDIALLNTLGYLVLANDNRHMLPVANMHIRKDAADNYKTVLLTLSDSISTYDVLQNKAGKLSMMFVSEGSTSGNLVPRLFLSSINIPSPEAQFREVKYGGNHTSTFEKLLQGETDLCAIGSNEYFEQLAADTTLKNKVKLVWISEEIPLGPVLVNHAFSAEEKEQITATLLNLHTHKPEAFETVKAGWSEAQQADKFQLISDEYYNSFREVNGNRTSLNDILNMFEK